MRGCAGGVVMQPDCTARRSVLTSLATMGSLALAGCSSLNSLTGAGTPSGSGRYLPGGTAFWGDRLESAAWFNTQAAYENKDALKQGGLYEIFQFAFGVSGDDVSFDDFEQIYYAMDLGLTVFEGADAALMKSVLEDNGLELTDEYHGYELGTITGYSTRAIGIQDGRAIFVEESGGLPEPVVGLKAVIDTVRGEVEPYLGSFPDVDAAEKFLDRDLFWEFRPHHAGRLEGLRSIASSFSVLNEKFRVKAIYGFDPAAEIREDEVTTYATGRENHVFGLNAPSYDRVENVVVFEETRSF